MASTNNERVGKALDLLHTGLRPFVERELRAVYGDRWTEQVQVGFADTRSRAAPNFDAQKLLGVMWEQWHEVFRRTLGQSERSLVSELRDTRNRWAHQEAFSTDDAYRAFDSIDRLLSAVSAPEAAEVERQKQELLRVRFEEQTRRESRKVAAAPLEGKLPAGLRPWREVVTPHPDVASGRYEQAEFAADLGQVHRGEGAAEYRDPREFFARTFLTEGLRHLLTNALRRLSGQGGDPAVELQTNFGGGKTHSLLALYHLCSGQAAGELAGIEPVLREAAVEQLPTANRAILVGTALSPAQARRKPDGTMVHTLWGELAWQLGGASGYEFVADADRRGINPGSDALRDLFIVTSPCLVLIDEWVAFVRQLYGVESLPAGSFDANLTFVQSLTEAARQAPQTLVVASIPASKIEVGGEGGQVALERIKHTFGRMESAWRPASAEEGFEIVRRRLFQPLPGPEAFRQRDAVARAFAELYRQQPSEFPANCREGDYERRFQAAYPIHPELFDRLYNDWSSLDRFQRTRGVLRLMAAVIHTLWERQDGGLLIMPASVPIDAPSVLFELTRYLEEPWVPVIEKDVDGPTSLPLQLDRENPNLGRYSAARRVARTLYLGSAPTLHTSQRGLDARSIALGCAQPGESVATFSDALRRLTDQATHLYADNARYWFSTQPSVTRLAQDRAALLSPEAVQEELVRRLKGLTRTRGEFQGVHVAPASSADVPDEPEARLVVLAPKYPHSGKATDSPARQAVVALLEGRGSSPRRYRNALLFLAPDRARLQELEAAVRQALAWASVRQEQETLNLDAFQRSQAESKGKQAEETVERRIPECYTWLLAPTQEPQGAVDWEELRLQPNEKLIENASRKLVAEEHLLTAYAPTLLHGDLDRIPLWRGEHVGTKQLWEDFAQYPYLRRLRNADVLLRSIAEGVRQLTWQTETFAYAEGWDEQRGRYRGLHVGEGCSVLLDANSLVVRPEAARRQLDAEQAKRPTGELPAAGAAISGGYAPGRPDSAPAASTASGVAERGGPTTPQRFFGTVRLEPLRVGRDAGAVAQEVIQHLSGLVDAEVDITLEVQVRVPGGIPEQVARTVSENCRVLKFTSAEFEER